MEMEEVMGSHEVPWWVHAVIALLIIADFGIIHRIEKLEKAHTPKAEIQKPSIEIHG